MASIDAYNHLDNPTALEHFRGRLRGGVRADVLLPSKSYAVQSTLLEYRLLSSVAEFETLEVEGDHREVDDDAPATPLTTSAAHPPPRFGLPTTSPTFARSIGLLAAPPAGTISSVFAARE